MENSKSAGYLHMFFLDIPYGLRSRILVVQGWRVQRDDDGSYCSCFQMVPYGTYFGVLHSCGRMSLGVEML